MRLLTLPYVSSPVGRDPYYYDLMEMVSGFAKTKKRAWFEIVLPDDESGYQVDVPLSGENYQVWRAPFGSVRLIEEVAPTRELYRYLNVRTSPVSFDGVLNQRTGMGALVKKMVKPKTKGMFHTDCPVFHLYSEVRTDELVLTGVSPLYGEDEMLLDLSAALTDYSIVIADLGKKNLMDLGRLYLNGSKLRELDKRCCVLPAIGIQYDKVKEYAVPRPHDKPVVVYGGRWTDHVKNVSTVLEVFRLMHDSGCAADFVCCSPYDEPKLHAKWSVEYPFVDFRMDVSREEHLANAGGCDVFVYCSKYESFCLTAAEFMLAGVVGVFLRFPWVDVVYPDYPFIADTPQELAAKARWAVEHLDEARKIAKPYVERLKKLDVSLQRCEEVYRFIDEKVRQSAGKGAGGQLKELVQEALDQHREVGSVTEAELWKTMTALSRAGREFGKTGDRLTKLYLRQMVRKCGWDDACDGPEPRFVHG